MTIREVNIINEKLPEIMEAIELACEFAYENSLYNEDEEMAEQMENHFNDLLDRLCREMQKTQKQYINELKQKK